MVHVFLNHKFGYVYIVDGHVLQKWGRFGCKCDQFSDFGGGSFGLFRDISDIFYGFGFFWSVSVLFQALSICYALLLVICSCYHTDGFVTNSIELNLAMLDTNGLPPHLHSYIPSIPQHKIKSPCHLKLHHYLSISISPCIQYLLQLNLNLNSPLSRQQRIHPIFHIINATTIVRWVGLGFDHTLFDWKVFE